MLRYFSLTRNNYFNIKTRITIERAVFMHANLMYYVHLRPGHPKKRFAADVYF